MLFDTIKPSTGLSDQTQHFADALKAFEELCNKPDPDIPLITKSLPIMKWFSAFHETLKRTFGTRRIPLAYATRPDAATATPPPALAQDQPYSDEHGSMMEEYIARATHSHTNFNSDNSLLYGLLEVATRSTMYAASIQAFAKKRDGRGAYLALKEQHLGVARWMTEIQKHEYTMYSIRWKGTGNFTIQQHVSNHRNAYTQLAAAGMHVPHQLPNERSRVAYLLKSIESNDPTLLAAVANINSDTDVPSLQDNFERAAALIQAACPVEKRISGNKRAHISAFSSDTSSQAHISALQCGIGSSGVHFRFYDQPEYRQLNSAQKKELALWRETPSGKAAVAKSKASSQSSRKKSKSQGRPPKNMSALVAKEVAKYNAPQSPSAMRAAVMSAIGELVDFPPATPAVIVPPPSTMPMRWNTEQLQGILRNARNANRN